MTVSLTLLGCWVGLSVLAFVEFGASWMIPLSTGLTVAVLYTVAAGSGARGWHLFRILLLVYAAIAVVNIQIEAYAFEVLPGVEVVRATMMGLLTATLVAAAMAGALTSGQPAPAATASTPRLAASPAVRLPAVVAGYVVLYLIAGAIIYPFVRDFYESGAVAVPALGVIVATQVVRGLIYAVALVPLFRALDGRRGRAAVLAGLALAVLGGLAPLLMPVDDVLPWTVRRVHIVEILWSNFALGTLAAWLLVRRQTNPTEATPHGVRVANAS